MFPPHPTTTVGVGAIMEGDRTLRAAHHVGAVLERLLAPRAEHLHVARLELFDPGQFLGGEEHRRIRVDGDLVPVGEYADTRRHPQAVETNRSLAAPDEDPPVSRSTVPRPDDADTANFVGISQFHRVVRQRHRLPFLVFVLRPHVRHCYLANCDLVNLHFHNILHNLIFCPLTLWHVALH